MGEEGGVGWVEIGGGIARAPDATHQRSIAGVGERFPLIGCPIQLVSLRMNNPSTRPRTDISRHRGVCTECLEFKLCGVEDIPGDAKALRNGSTRIIEMAWHRGRNRDPKGAVDLTCATVIITAGNASGYLTTVDSPC